MTDIELNLHRGNKENLDNVLVTDGNLIFTKDTGEIFADFGEERIPFTHVAKGGTRAFAVLAIDEVSKSITLDSAEGLQVNDLCSAIVKNNYNSFGTITAIDGTTVTFDNIPMDYTIDEKSYLWVPERPEVGTQTIGSYSAKTGYNNKANGMGSFACGEDNIADGKRSFAAGRGNYVGYGGAVVGQDNKVYGFFGLTAGDHNTIYSGANNTFTTGAYNQLKNFNGMANGEYNWITGRNSFVTGSYNTAGGNNSFVGGTNSQTYYANTFAFGDHLLTNGPDQIVFGKYNEVSNYVFSIGVGTSDSARDNALAVTSDGYILVTKSPMYPVHVANKAYVDAVACPIDSNKNAFNGASHTINGVNNRVSGDSNQITGNNNAANGYGNIFTSNNGIVSGQSHGVSVGSNAYVGGSNNQAYSSSYRNIFMHGDHLWATGSNQAAFGQYNRSSSDLIFTVGIGSSSEEKNGFAVTTDGRATVARDPIYSMDVATKQYVDSHAGSGGSDGYSPTATVSKSGRISTITITDKNGTTTSKVYDGTNGTNGTDGSDGYSPTATVTRISNGATITITDKNGTTTATVYDGTDGEDGSAGITPAKYITNFTTQTATNLAGGTAGTWKITTWSDGTKEAELIVSSSVSSSSSETNGTYTAQLNPQGVAYIKYPTDFSSSDYREVFILNNRYAITPKVEDHNGTHMGAFIGYSCINIPQHSTKLKYKLTKA